MSDDVMLRECSYREAVREALEQEMLRDETVFLIGEDIGAYGGSFHVLEGLHELFGPERVIETPISEQGFTGVAIGAALMGRRPVVEFMFSDFLAVAMDQIVNQAAKYRFMFGGSASVPLVIRTPSGSGTGAGAQHSQSLEAWFCHVPGLKVVVPSSPHDAKGLLIAAIRDPDPVLFFEQKLLYDTTGAVPREPYAIALGTAAVRTEGCDLTIVTYGRMTALVLTAVSANPLLQGLVEVLDMRTLAPLDMLSVHRSVRKTGRVLIVHEAVRSGGIGAEIASRICEDAVSFAALKAPVRRLCGQDVPIPFSPALESASVPSAADVSQVIDELLF
ncbi:MAG: alpha-ketoacid dehydrogenase subunit beta [Spirochaetia bacterium]|nr:alpha-ketoacid dehydrogenase subunit beta [Spirochaetia bacterium]